LVDPNPLSPLPHRPPLPGLARFGIVVMAFGLLLDFVEHDLVTHIDEQRVAGFPLSEHTAHLVVLIGMVLVLTGIVRTGRRLDRRHPHQPRSLSHAVR
jgi:uncharacterized protein YjeT (DUF2065 family)